VVTLELKWLVPQGNETAFETVIKNIFIPAVSRQPGFLGCAFLREFDDAALAKMGVARDPHGYRLNISFETEELRLCWAETPEHDHAVGQALKVATELVACGFDVIANKP
jgi:heme-degrading monooxygenase HmoA